MKINNKTIGGLLWSFGERISAQLVTLIVSIVLARLLSPEEFSLIAIVLIFIAIANAFVTGGFGNSLIQKKDSDELDFSTTLIFSFTLSIVFYIIIYISAPWISSYYGKATLTPLFRILGLRIIIASINSIQHAYVSKKMEFKKFFYSTTFGTVISGVVGVTMAFMGYGVWALAYQYLTNTVIDTIVLCFTCGWKPKLKFSCDRMKILFSYGWKLLVVSVTQTIYEELRGLILSKKFNPCELSFYNQGDKFPALFINNIDVSVNKVMFQRLCDEQGSKVKVLELTRMTLQYIMFFMVPIFIILAACSNQIVLILLSEKWTPCIVYMKLICFTYLLYPIVSTLTRTMKALGKSGLFLSITLFRYIIGALLIIGAIVLYNSPLVVVITNMIAYLIVVLLSIYYTKKLVGYQIIHQVKDILLPLLAGFIAYFITISIDSLCLSDFAILLLKLVVSLSSYILFSYILNREIFKSLKSVYLKNHK